MAERSTHIRMILLSEIIPDPNQPRKTLRGVERMVGSLAMEGQLSPIHVAQTLDGTYQIIDGEQRYEGAKSLGWHDIACMVIEASSDEKIRDLQFHANFFRDYLDPFELADEMFGLMKRKGWTETQLAEVTRWSRSTISSTLGLTNVPTTVRQRLNEVCTSIAREKLFLVARATTVEEMNAVVDQIIAGESIAEIRGNRRAKRLSSDTTRTSKKMQEVSQKKIGGISKTTGSGSQVDELTGLDRAPGVYVPEPKSSAIPDKVDMPVEPSSVVEEQQVGQEMKDEAHGHGQTEVVSMIIDHAEVQESARIEGETGVGSKVAHPDSEQQEMAKVEVSPKTSQQTIDESIVEHWWEAYTVHAVRVAQLRAVAKEAAFRRLDIPGWLERVQGTVIGGYTVLVVPVVQDKRVYQLVPISLSRQDYVEQMQAQLVAMKTKLGKKQP